MHHFIRQLQAIRKINLKNHLHSKILKWFYLILILIKIFDLIILFKNQFVFNVLFFHFKLKRYFYQLIILKNLINLTNL